MVRSTGAFMVAAMIALVISKWRLGHVSRMQWLSTILILGFGGLTVLLADPYYVQIKPTVLYIFFGSVLLVGWWRGKALLQWLLEAAFEGLDDEGWLKLSRNWGLFFFALAALNEGLRYWLSFGDWLRGAPVADRPPTLQDLDYHLTTLFPPVRPRGYVEIRCADALPDHRLRVTGCGAHPKRPET